jgi:hypothetical protein
MVAMKTFLSVLLIIIWYSAGYAASNKEVYELQERCGKRAAELFQKYFGINGISNDKDGQRLSNYTCHYNRKLNKCFMLITSRGYPKDKKEQKNFGASTDKGLWDINENKNYGQFFKFDKAAKTTMTCEVLEKSCNYEGEWDLLVKPYMEE